MKILVIVLITWLKSTGHIFHFFTSISVYGQRDSIEKVIACKTLRRYAGELSVQINCLFSVCLTFLAGSKDWLLFSEI